MINARMFIEEKVRNDFDEFDFADKPMEKYCAYNRTKHIQMATQIVQNYCDGTFIDDYTTEDVNDLIHGLNHLFFNGVAAGQAFEWNKGKRE